MTTIAPHTTRGTGTILTAAIYNTDHGVHITNANALNGDKLERSGVVTPGNFAVWTDDDFIEDGGTPGSMAFEAAADYALLASANVFTATQTVQSSDAGATAGPSVILDRFSASPAASDLLGQMLFRGRNLTPASVDYASILAQILDETAGSEDARLVWRTIVAGSLGNRMLLGQGLFMTGATGGDQGAGTLNATALYQNGVRDWTRIFKSADQTGSNTTFISDTELLFPILAATDYVFRGTMFYDTPTAADFKTQFTGPASPTLANIGYITIPPGGTIVDIADKSSEAFSTSVQVTATTGTFGAIRFEGIIKNGANAGDVTMQWAQVANSGTTTLRKGSYLEYRQL